MHVAAQYPVRKPSHADKRSTVAGTADYEIERKLIGYAYARNAVETATPQYCWKLYLAGRLVDSANRRGPLISGAREDAYR